MSFPREDDIATIGVPEDRNLDKIHKAWNLAQQYSEARLSNARTWSEEQLETARVRGHVILETVCLFVHACLKSGQFKLPSEFWRILHLEYGIHVYPSAFAEKIKLSDGEEETFTSAYSGHIVMYGRGHNCQSHPPCPFDHLQTPPPKYEKSAATIVRTKPYTEMRSLCYDMVYAKEDHFPSTGESSEESTDSEEDEETDDELQCCPTTRPDTPDSEQECCKGGEPPKEGMVR